MKPAITDIRMEDMFTDNPYHLLSKPSPNLRGLTALVIGMGESGVAATNLLLREGAQVWAYDINPQKETQLRQIWEPRGVRVLTGTLQPMVGIDFAVVSPGVPPFGPIFTWLAQAEIPLLGEMELACRFLSRPIIAVTGTNGKTTTVNMIHHILKSCGYESDLAGNVGYPVAQLATEKDRQGHQPIVLEVSSYQCETFEEFKADIALITNLAPDHLERYNSIRHYYETKFQIAINQTPNEALLMGPMVEGDCPNWVESRRLSFGIQDTGLQGVFYSEHTLIIRDGSKEERHSCPSFDQLPTQQVLNTLAAVAATTIFRVPLDEALAAMESFLPLPHRLEYVGSVQGIRCYNDSKATNVHALEAALRSLPAPIRLIAGGRSKGDSLDPVADLIREKVSGIYLIGEAREEFARAWGSLTSVQTFSTLEEAVHQGLRDGSVGEILLLSPACASWDMISSYKERGDRFREAVKEYVK